MKKEESAHSPKFAHDIKSFSKKATRFIARQCQPQQRSEQTAFDLLFGVLLPLAILIADPLVFKAGWPITLEGSQASLLGLIRVFAYLLIGFWLLFLCFSLCLQEKCSPVINAASGGFFMMGAITALSTGGFLLLFTTPLMFVILIDINAWVGKENEYLVLAIIEACIAGAALIPVAFVYLRNSIKAIFRSLKNLTWWQVIVSVIVGCAMLTALPFSLQAAANFYVNQKVERLLQNKEAIDMEAVNSLKNAFWCELSCYRKLFNAYNAALLNEDERVRLEQIYFLITGRDIDDRWDLIF